MFLDSALQHKINSDLLKSLGHLEYSTKKAGQILNCHTFTEDQLEDLEGFGSRFARASDITIQKWLRFKALEKDPGFRGGVVDVLNLAEKFGWIQSAETWKRIRELRNASAHEYSEGEARELYREMARLATTILSVRDHLSP